MIPQLLFFFFFYRLFVSIEIGAAAHNPRGTSLSSSAVRGARKNQGIRCTLVLFVDTSPSLIAFGQVSSRRNISADAQEESQPSFADKQVLSFCAGLMSSNAKRMCLTRDQRAVLEAVYAMEKLPDADLRERLSSYLNLSTRQVQVWSFSSCSTHLRHTLRPSWIRCPWGRLRFPAAGEATSSAWWMQR